MVSLRAGIGPKEINPNDHVLFVEGKDKNSFDPEMLTVLFDNALSIQTLGPSYSVKSVAEALYPHHPTYYFLIDRDHQDDVFIDKCWTNFPNSETHNLLVWKRREIENYFLEPKYLFTSKYCKVDKEVLERRVLEFSKARLFFDAANHVIISIREELKQNWIKIFPNPNDFPNKEAALEKLINANEFEEHASNVTQKVLVKELEIRFNNCLNKMTNGQDELSFGTGSWLSMIQGKKVLRQIINSECFQVLATDENPLVGKERLNAVIKNLLKKDESILPTDIIDLRKLILDRLNGN